MDYVKYLVVRELDFGPLYNRHIPMSWHLGIFYAFSVRQWNWLGWSARSPPDEYAGSEAGEG
jgi:hypothetical protein